MVINIPSDYIFSDDKGKGEVIKPIYIKWDLGDLGNYLQMIMDKSANSDYCVSPNGRPYGCGIIV